MTESRQEYQSQSKGRGNSRLKLTLWAAADKGLPMLYGAAVVIIPLHMGLLDKDAWGTWVVFQTLFLSISLVGDYFILQPVVKLAAEADTEAPPIITAGALLYAIVSIVLAAPITLLAPQVAGVLKVGGLGTAAFAWMVWTNIATIPRNISIRVLQIDYHMPRIFLLDLVYFGGFVVLMIYGWQVAQLDSTIDMVYYNLAALIGSSIVGAALCGWRLKPAFHGLVGAAKRIVGIGTHQGGTGVLTITQQNVDVAIVAGTRGSTAAGIYTAARIFYRTFEALREAGQLLLISATSNAYSRNETERVEDISVLATAALVALLYPATIVLILIAPIFLPIILPDYASATSVFQWLIASGFAMPFIIVPSAVLLGIGQTRTLFRGMLIGTIVLVSSGLALTYAFGPDGMAVGILLGNTTIATLLISRLNRHITFSFPHVLRRSRGFGTLVRERIRDFRGTPPGLQ